MWLLLFILFTAPASADDRTLTCPPVPGAERYLLQVRAETGTTWRTSATYSPATATEAPVMQYRCPLGTRKWLRLCAQNAAGTTCQTKFGAWCSEKAERP